MAEMASTAGAVDLGAYHAVTTVFYFLNVFFDGRIVEAGPSATGFELGFRGKELKAAGGAEINAGSLGVSVLSGEGAFGAFFAKDAVLLRGKRSAPLFIRLTNLFHDVPRRS